VRVRIIGFVVRMTYFLFKERLPNMKSKGYRIGGWYSTSGWQVRNNEGLYGRVGQKLLADTFGVYRDTFWLFVCKWLMDGSGSACVFGFKSYAGGLIRLFLVLGGFCTAVMSSLGQNESITYTNLALYLTNRAWIKEVEIDFSKNRYQPVDFPPEHFQGFTRWQASLQPGGFFFQCKSNPPFDPMLAYGESSNFYWQISSRGISVAPKRPEEGGSEENGRQIMCLHFKRVLIDALNLGIEGLDNERITWISENEFTSPLLDWVGKPTAGQIHVIVESYSNGLPTRLRCETKTPNANRVARIFCEYDQPSLPPHRVICELVDNDNKVLRLTNIIRRITFGVRDESERGFLPEDLLPPGFVPKVKLVASNGVRYLVLPDGSLKLVDEDTARDIVPVGRRQKAKPLIYAIFAVSFLGVPAVMALIWALKKRW